MRKAVVFLVLGLLLGVCQAELPGYIHHSEKNGR
jgi:hypothetical protein